MIYLDISDILTDSVPFGKHDLGEPLEYEVFCLSLKPPRNASAGFDTDGIEITFWMSIKRSS